jgi:hypothetical protein
MGTTVQVKCLLRNGVLPLLLASAWVHCTLIVVQRGERAEFTLSSTINNNLIIILLLIIYILIIFNNALHTQ